MPNVIDMTGKRFGRLVVLCRAENSRHGFARWKCLCDCGSFVIVYGSSLRTGKTTSCGCYGKERQLAAVRTHGLSRTPLYRAWDDMRRRCRNKSNKFYKDYGGRGISFCSDWNRFEPFRDWALSNGYKHGLTLDRIDNDGDYSPENCRWVTMYVQNRNKRNNVWLTYKGKTKIVSDWAKELGVKPDLILRRLKKYDVETTLSMPFTKRRSKHGN